MSEVVFATGGYDEKVILWNPSTEVAIRVIQMKDAHVNAIAVTPDKQYLAVAAHKSLRLYDLNTTSAIPIHTYEGHPDNIMSIGFPRRSNWIYTAGEDGTIRIWDFSSHKYQRVHERRQPINQAILHPNESEILAGYEDGVIGNWDIAQNAFRELHREEEASIRSLQISADATHGVFCNSIGEACLWRLEDTLQVLYRTRAHNSYITSCTVSADQKLLATCSADKTIKLWTVNTEEGVLTLDKALIGHKMWVWGACFTCDSAYLASVSTDCTAKLWEVSSGRIARNYIGGHSKGITALILNDY